MTKFREAHRVDLAILDALWMCKSPITLSAMYSHIYAHETWVSLDAVASWLRPLEVGGFLRVVQGADSSVPLYALTDAGRGFLIAGKRALDLQSSVEPADPPRRVFHEEPIAVSACNRPEPEVPDAAQAVLCVDEDELNDWWDALDVEAKADAFVQFSLADGGHNSHVYIEPKPRAVTEERTQASERLKTQLRESLHLARPQCPPDEPLPIDLLCTKCGERGGNWRRLHQENVGVAPQAPRGYRHALSNDNSGPWLYAHSCIPSVVTAAGQSA